MRIDDMKPAELNRKFAELALNARICTKDQPGHFEHGWKVVIAGDESNSKPLAYTNQNLPWQTAKWRTKDEIAWKDIPDYSTTWEGMRLVVEEMQRRGWEFTLYWSDGRDESEQWVCTFSKGVGMNMKHYRAYGISAPHSTMLAAIKALQGEDTQP